MVALVELSPWEIVFPSFVSVLVICSIFWVICLCYVKSVEGKIEIGEGTITYAF